MIPRLLQRISCRVPALALGLLGLVLLPACATSPKASSGAPEAASPSGKTTAANRSAPATIASEEDDLDEYSVVEVFDPIERLNRVTFTVNHALYKGLLRPIAKGYQFVVPQPIRRGIGNAYDNVRFPVRFVNHALQGKIPRAGQEAGKFLVNSTLGLGGLLRMSDKFPALASVPSADTGQTFAKWGIDHGFYVVLPVLGPSSARDTVGLAGDTALNPISWVSFVFGGAFWTLAVTSPDTVRSLPDRMDQYDAVTKEAVDRYLAARSSYIQYRAAAAKR